MADKRMFSSKIVSSDAFKEMPLSAQALYFHLGMNADDEGFLNNAKSVQRSILATEDDMKLLLAKNFIILFETGIVVIKHWRMHNSIQPSKLIPTQYTEERAILHIKENKSYTLSEVVQTIADEMPTDCRRIADESPHSIVESRVVESSIDKSSVVEHQDTPTYEKLCEVYGTAFVDERIERGKSYRGITLDKIAKWCEEDFKKTPKNKPNRFNQFEQRDYDYTEMEKRLLKNAKQ